MRLYSMIFVTISTIAVATTAPAQDLLRASAPEAIVSLFQNAGLQAKLSKDSDGDPLIASSASGVDFDLFFYGCSDGKDCSSVQFIVCLDLIDGEKMAVINNWNAEVRYATAFLDDEFDPCLEMNIEMSGGLPAETFESALDTWTWSLGRFTTKIDY